ncbi:conjugal transfer protein TraD [Mesorhizobium sp. Root102]|uniref:conjugal transfer protein TraD n=1 Tax=Mesorhizobium sp. Root102 TaxID=1736422 RepID=UPI003299C5AB
MNMQRRQSSQGRKRDTREKIQLGGLVVKAGLRTADRAVILGALIDAARRMDKQSELARLRAVGKAAFGNDSQEAHAHDRAGRTDDRNAVGSDWD